MSIISHEWMSPSDFSNIGCYTDSLRILSGNGLLKCESATSIIHSYRKLTVGAGIDVFIA